MLKALRALRESMPGGEARGAPLIDRAAEASRGRPAILPPDLAAHARRCLSLRDWAVRGLDVPFRAGLARPAIESACVVMAELPDRLSEFVAAVDPEGLAADEGPMAAPKRDSPSPGAQTAAARALSERQGGPTGRGTDGPIRSPAAPRRLRRARPRSGGAAAKAIEPN